MVSKTSWKNLKLTGKLNIKFRMIKLYFVIVSFALACLFSYFTFQWINFLIVWNLHGWSLACEAGSQYSGTIATVLFGVLVAWIVQACS